MQVSLPKINRLYVLKNRTESGITRNLTYNSTQAPKKYHKFRDNKLKFQCPEPDSNRPGMTHPYKKILRNADSTFKHRSYHKLFNRLINSLNKQATQFSLLETEFRLYCSHIVGTVQYTQPNDLIFFPQFYIEVIYSPISSEILSIGQYNYIGKQT